MKFIFNLGYNSTTGSKIAPKETSSICLNQNILKYEHVQRMKLERPLKGLDELYKFRFYSICERLNGSNSERIQRIVYFVWNLEAMLKSSTKWKNPMFGDVNKA